MNYIYELEQAFLEYEFLSEEEKNLVRKKIRNVRKIRAEKEKAEIEAKKVDTLSLELCNKFFNEALEILQERKSISAQVLQSRFKIGYSTANYIIEELENKGYCKRVNGRYILVEDE